MSDEKLYNLCQRYGKATLFWRRRFLGLLPEVQRRRLYEKKGFGSIFDFAARLAGVSEEQVRVVLRLEKRFEDKPTLKELLVKGKASVHKLARVVSIATVENEEELAGKVQVLSRVPLETFVRDFKIQNGLNKPLFDLKSLHVQTLEFELSTDVIEELNRLNRDGHEVNVLLSKLLSQRRERIQQQKEELTKELKQTNSRYRPVKVQRLLKEEYGEKCSIPHCAKLAEEIHHTQRFSLSRTHDPRYLAPLCKAHHQLAHAVDVKVQEWRMRSLDP